MFSNPDTWYHAISSDLRHHSSSASIAATATDTPPTLVGNSYSACTDWKHAGSISFLSSSDGRYEGSIHKISVYLRDCFEIVPMVQNVSAFFLVSCCVFLFLLCIDQLFNMFCIKECQEPKEAEKSNTCTTSTDFHGSKVCISVTRVADCSIVQTVDADPIANIL